ncbi:hypothetical protein BJ875DRAFT_483906 [Amylocarpus encephaloides]|uniref:Uncharacterized protein n=1 Tax=Amylocarpus encephaloides TaxID=45428 RepID=A0A9P7YJN4_9HELO|nr:hypothetical protein BJ875DRAFT_483906 [Amylocarpus encephaloides]
MSFGWSFGDVVAGINLVFKIYTAISDGPRSSRAEATQFFNEFNEVVLRLDQWEARKLACGKDGSVTVAHEELKEDCTVFIKRHMKLLHDINPGSKSSRPGRSTWLRMAQFSGQQIAELYKQVQWPFERKEVARLRERLQSFLQISSWDVAIDTNGIVRDFRDTHAELLSSNLKLVSSHLELVSLITLNLKRVTHPLDPGTEIPEIDYPMLRQFDQALRPPEPLRALQSASPRNQLPWAGPEYNMQGEQRSTASRPGNPHHDPYNQTELRGLISRRLDNMSMRVRRVETLESLPEEGSTNSASTTQDLLQRLQGMREQIGNAVGISDQDQPEFVTHLVSEPESALRYELDAWNTLEERIEQKILHPIPPGLEVAPCSDPIPVPTRIVVASLSPPQSPYGGWHGPPHGSTDSCRSYLSSSVGVPQSSPYRRSSSVSSVSPTPSLRLNNSIRTQIAYSTYTILALIHTIRKNDSGEVLSIYSTSRDGNTEIRHNVDYKAPTLMETSMKPWLDNRHADKNHRLRVQFKGAHNLKITNYLEFQKQLLGKEVHFCADVCYIKSTNDRETQMRQGTIRILYDEVRETRHILYFRHTLTQNHAFVEWPARIFKEPVKPRDSSKSLTLDSLDGKSLTLAKGIRGAQRSVTTIGSFESAGTAFGRPQDRGSENKSIRGLIIDFYDHQDCLNFWTEFRKKGGTFGNQDIYGLGLGLPAELPATFPVELPV